MVRSYRVEVVGQFDSPSAELRQALLAEQDAHDVFKSAFTADGTFAYARSLARFTLRYLIDIDEESAVEADAAAAVEGELRALDYLQERGIPARALTTSATCLQDVKVQRKRSRR